MSGPRCEDVKTANKGVCFRPKPSPNLDPDAVPEGIHERSFLLFGVVNRATLLWSEITELGKTWQVTTKGSAHVGSWHRDPVILVRGAIWNATDQTRAYGTALVSRLSREVRSPGRLDSGSGITVVGPRW